MRLALGSTYSVGTRHVLGEMRGKRQGELAIRVDRLGEAVVWPSEGEH